MCVQYRGGCSVPWGISWVPWGDILSTMGVFSTVGGYHDKCGGISWVPWGVFSTMGGISWVPWGDILSTVGDVQYRGGISWCTWGISWCTWGDIMGTVGDIILWNLSTVGGSHDTCGGISWVPWGVFSTVGYSNNKRLFPPRYWTPSMVLMISPHGTEHPPCASWYPPTVLKITHHGTHDIPPRYWTPPTVLHTHYTGW